MREILFRGKPLANPKLPFIYGSLLVFNDCYSIKENKSFAFEKPINPETLCEFTGIKDKNGVRVFEGDIVRADNGHIGYVVFRNGSFVKVCSCHDSINTLYGDNETVIGNIYDNPELLEEESK